MLNTKFPFQYVHYLTVIHLPHEKEFQFDAVVICPFFGLEMKVIILDLSVDFFWM